MPVFPMSQVVEPTTPTAAPKNPDPSPTDQTPVLPLAMMLGRVLTSWVPLSKFSLEYVRLKPELLTMVIWLVIDSMARSSRASTASRIDCAREFLFRRGRRREKRAFNCRLREED